MRCRVIFDGRYKLIESVNDETELYDLVIDPLEAHNIAHSEAGKKRELQAMLQTIR